MLKALELTGFKSFADKTRFEFPPGITVIVGPNGSGKSNIVDGMKWVLGEQSAKSLRGKDMADVIFKGAGEGTRRMQNTAEATIIFDNSEGRLPVDAPEVHVTRRVYRSGEGEYLVNRQPCRLKDIKDLFRGSGVGTDAYSLIEQGKVDRMLQASPRDRRAIFEEAAGISRFKAKKVEAQRRLERVDQNMLRLSDIVEEVESRLRSVRSQASKARRYREYSQRLQQLRTQVGLTDWRHLSEQLVSTEAELSHSRNRAGEIGAQAERLEARALELDVEIANAIESVRLCENRVAHSREQIAVLELSVVQAHARCSDLEEARHRDRRQLASMTGRAGDVKERLSSTTTGLQQAESAHREISERLEGHQQSLEQATRELDRHRQENETRRQEYLEQVRQVATSSNRISNLELQQDAAQATEQRTRKRLADLQSQSRASADELQEAEAREQQFGQQVELQRNNLNLAQNQLHQLEDQLASNRDQLGQVQRQFSAANERATVLDELEKNQEGLSVGVREILRLAQQTEEGPLVEVQGLVADLLQVGFENAPVVDVALGETAQYVAVIGGRLFEEIQSGRFCPDGRVGFVRLDDDSPPRQVTAELDGQEGVGDRLDQLVSFDPRVAGLVQRLLGDTWLVDSLSIALALRATTGANARFVTLAGDLVERDGAVLVGARTTATSLVSRRSELQQLRGRASEYKQHLSELEGSFERLKDSRLQQSTAVRQLELELSKTADELGEQRIHGQAFRERCEQLKHQAAELNDELQNAVQSQSATTKSLEVARADLSAAEQVAGQLETEVRRAEEEIEQVDGRREEHALRTNAAKVELARSEQQLAALRIQLQQFQADRQERSRALSELEGQQDQCQARIKETERELLRATSGLALLYLDRERRDRATAEQLANRVSLTSRKGELAQQGASLRREKQEIDDLLRQQGLAVNDIQHQRNALADRLREDYAIDIAAHEGEATAEEQEQRDAIEQEIADLRRKVNNIGAVNVDALEELDDLESRFSSLSSQYQDLQQAKEALERIIQKINADSRRLFQDTLEVIRENFQGLYRKAFGGGRADLVLEEGVDVLEAGVDIIATPPGKPSFNNSLLSGGEKALTAVSLLLAIFQYRPSPFCVLDEVDAPFDEANIGRFVDVLKGFLGWTKFVVVTHSKQTMTAATTLYGVTMQESGVSKRVSVRFEDVSEDGHISQEAIDRDAANEDKEDDERGAA